jgi:hypothetical protein
MALAGDGQCAAAGAEAARATAGGRVGPPPTTTPPSPTRCAGSGPAVTQTLHAIDGGVVSDVRTNPDLKSLLSDPTLKKRLR